MAEVTGSEFEIDVDWLERKYAEERDKRLRDDAMQQYQSLTDKFSNFAKDPNADPNFSRQPVIEDTDVLIIGGGFAGLLAGGRLREQGIDDIRIIEKGSDFGGTWYWNRYPGAACDVEATIYLPLLEELGYLPRERYPRSSEIYEHCRKLAKRFNLYPAALFQTEAQFLEWNATSKRWIVKTSRNDLITARFIISCAGLLSNPKLPGIPGIDSFKGHMFHTSRWDYDYTQGGESGGLSGLSDKCVGIIGTGSTGVQVVPHLAASAKQLFVFQRTPASVDVRNNGPLQQDHFKALPVGWQRERRDNFTTILGGGYAPIDLVQDSWTDIIRNVAPRQKDGTLVVDPEALKLAELRKMDLVRRRVDTLVEDPKTAEALKPYFHYFCKRPCFHDEYLQSFNQPNVTLVDTEGKGVEKITPFGIVANGKDFPLDCLIFATGFDFLTDYCREAGLEIIGSNGQTLSEHWKDGPRTFHGIMTCGFPNYFMMAIAQAGAAVNYVHTADEQTQNIVHIITECINRGVETVQSSKLAEEAWVEEVVSGSVSRREFLETCTPGYYSYEGKRDQTANLNDFYPAGPMAYIDVIRSWRESGTLTGLDLSPEL